MPVSNIEVSCSGNFRELSLLMLVISGPVSYTHLDVYKRQVTVTEELRREGIARELVNRIWNR